MTVVESLQTKIDLILKGMVVPNDLKFVLVDIPDHPNVGDSAIALGELACLRRLFPNAKISGFAGPLYGDGIFSHLESCDVIFLHGGGNFGDIWPHHHEIRLDILERFSHKCIVQFPQSIHFSGKDSLERTKLAIGKASNFHLLVRDLNSYAFAEMHLKCKVTLCPDMAFSLGPLRAATAKVDYSCLFRTDKEVLEPKAAEIEKALRNLSVSYETNDWLKSGVLDKANSTVNRIVGAVAPPAPVARYGLPLLESYGRLRLQRGSALLAEGRTVITDRLHGCIISVLLGRPVIVFDSLDGKIRAFYEAWLSEDPSIIFLDKVADLHDQLKIDSANRNRRARV